MHDVSLWTKLKTQGKYSTGLHMLLSGGSTEAFKVAYGSDSGWHVEPAHSDAEAELSRLRFFFLFS